jgi:hypothetical protein
MDDVIALLSSEEFWAGLALIVSLLVGNSTHPKLGGEKFKTLKRVKGVVK